jgi:hypothetical protein
VSRRQGSSKLGWAIGAAVAAVALGAFVFAVISAQQLPEGPVPIVWDKEACAYCQMHIGEPHFAAQAQLADGRVLGFDDPGCLMRWLQASPSAQVHALYFHHMKEDRWLSGDEVGFVETFPTPMGFNLGAVDRTTPGAKSFEEARAQAVRGAGERR